MINKNLENSIKEFNKLSIQVNLNGLSFCVVNTLNNTILDSDSITFEEERTPHGLQKGLTTLFQKHNIVSKKFSEVIVIHSNKLFSLVPKPLFNEKEIANYLKFNTKILANDHIAYDEFENYDIVNVYVPFVNINNYIYDLFGAFEYKHSGTIMAESLLTSQNNDKEATCYVHIAHKQMEITVKNQKNLLLYNCFDFTTKEDFIYYLLFTFEQLQLDTETTKLKLFGKVEEGDAIYNISYQYVKNVSIFVPSTSAYPTDGNNDSIDFTVLNTI